MTAVFLGLGSNEGARTSHLATAIRSLSEWPRTRVHNVSALYESEYVGPGPAQPSYLNACVELQTELSGAEILDRARALESAAGRVRRRRFGPRTLDVDVLLVGDRTIDRPELTVPHPRLHQRRFVLQPLLDLRPELSHPTRHARLAKLVEDPEVATQALRSLDRHDWWQGGAS